MEIKNCIKCNTDGLLPLIEIYNGIINSINFFCIKCRTSMFIKDDKIKNLTDLINCWNRLNSLDFLRESELLRAEQLIKEANEIKKKFST